MFLKQSISTWSFRVIKACLFLALILISISIKAEVLEKDKKRVDILLQSIEKFSQGSVYQYNFSKKAFEVSQHIKYEAGKARAALFLGDYFCYRENFEKASHYYSISGKFIEKYGTEPDKCKLYISLSEHYRSVTDYDRGVSYLNKALNIASNLKDKKFLITVYDRLASVFFEQKKLQASIYIANQGLFFIQYAPKKISSLYNIIGAAYREMNRRDSSIYYLSLAEKLAVEDKQEDILMNIYYNYSRLYEIEGNYKMALSYAQSGYKIAEKKQINVFKQMFSRVLSISNYELGNYKDAYLYQKENYEFREKRKDDLRKYTVLKIETSNKLILQNREIMEERKVLIFISAIMVVFVFFMSLFLLEKRNKQRSLLANNQELKEKNKIIQEQNFKLEELNKTKDRFFSIIAHDLRGPLGSFKSITELFLDQEENLSEDDRMELIAEMKNSSDILYNLLENLLIWARSQRGVIRFDPEPINLYSIINEIAFVFKTTIEHKKMDIEISVPENLEVRADKNMLSTIFRNMLSNAVKFSYKEGLIMISAELNRENRGWVKISIQDSGIGMTQKVLQSLFKIDEIKSTLGTSGEKGSGLGLILVKEFVEAHGGILTVEGAKDKGSKFTFSLPLA